MALADRACSPGGAAGCTRPARCPLALLVAVVLQIAISPAQNVVTRSYEAEADWVALQTSRDPRAAAQAVRGAGRDEPRPTRSRRPGRTSLFDTHPTAMQRIGDGRGLAGAPPAPLTAARSGRVAPTNPDQGGSDGSCHAATAARSAAQPLRPGYSRLSGQFRRRVPRAPVALEDASSSGCSRSRSSSSSTCCRP